MKSVYKHAIAICFACAPAFAQAATGGSGAPAQADNTGFYAGAGVGQARAKDACEGVTISCDDKDVAWRLLGGYQFHRNFAVEAGYVDFGKFTASGIISGVAVSANAKARALELLGLATLPLTDQISVYGKLGIARSRVKVSATGSVPGFATTLSASDNSTDLTFGLGAQYMFTRNLGARLEWQRYDSVGGDNTGKSDIDLFNAALVFKF